MKQNQPGDLSGAVNQLVLQSGVRAEIKQECSGLTSVLHVRLRGVW